MRQRAEIWDSNFLASFGHSDQTLNLEVLRTLFIHILLKETKHFLMSHHNNINMHIFIMYQSPAEHTMVTKRIFDRATDYRTFAILRKA